MKRLKKYCNLADSPRLYLILDEKPILWNLQKAVAGGHILGSGSFGTVYEVKFDGSEIPEWSSYASRRNIKKAAVKRLEIDITTIDELEIMLAMSKTKFGMQVFGCKLQIYDKKKYKSQEKIPEDKIYIVMDKLGKELTDAELLKKVAKLTPDERIRYYMELFEQVIGLYEKGFLHNDIKPENILYDENNDQMVVIDFGCAQKTNTNLKNWGTNVFMSPNKYSKVTKIAQLADDLFSLALSVVTIENQDDYEEIYTDDYGLVLKNCEKKKNENCLKNFVKRAEKILLRRGFSKPTSKFDKYNFVNLILRIIEFEHFNDSEDEVKKIVRTIASDAKDRISASKLKISKKAPPAKPAVEISVPAKKKEFDVQSMMADYKNQKDLAKQNEKDEKKKKKKVERVECSFASIFGFFADKFKI